eukprot:gene6920-8856_t
MEGAVDVVKALLVRGAEYNIPQCLIYNSVTDNVEPSTPLSAAIVNCHLEVLQVLLSAGCDVNTKIPVVRSKGGVLKATNEISKGYTPIINGDTPLHVVCDNKLPETLKLLLSIPTVLESKNDADLDKQNHTDPKLINSMSGLHSSVRASAAMDSKDFSTIEQPTDQPMSTRGDTSEDPSILGAASSASLLSPKRVKSTTLPINQRNKSGFTPLHLAVKRKSDALVHILLDAGADPTIGDFKNVTAYDLSCRLGKDSMIFKRLQSVISNLPIDNSGDSPAPTTATSVIPTVGSRKRLSGHTPNENSALGHISKVPSKGRASHVQPTGSCEAVTGTLPHDDRRGEDEARAGGLVADDLCLEFF